MQFVASIHYQDSPIARISSMSKDGMDHAATADEARESLIRDANRCRSGALTDSALDGIADAYRAAVLEHAASGEKGRYTCVARLKDDGTHSVQTLPGDYATLTRKGDLMGHIQILSDAEIEERDAFVERIMRQEPGSRAARRQA